MNNEEYEYEYCFGKRYYYWPWYKDNENEDTFWNPGKKYKDLYITPKYSNLKEEIVDNKIYNISITEYDRTYDKAIMYQEKSDVINTIRSSTKGYGKCHYNIGNNQVLRIEHIMSIMLYTDHQHLSLEFAMSFRRKSMMETENDFKAKKSEYANWDKFLRECVELYGTKMETNKWKTFYTGISSQIVFNQFRVNMHCPISASRQLSVIMMFGQEDDGIIIDLGQAPQPGNILKCFNCSLFSCYAEEDEFLFIGGYAPIQINSVRVIGECKNYQHFLKAFGYFDTIMNGAYDRKNKCSIRDFEIIDNLIQQLLDNNNDLKSQTLQPITNDNKIYNFPLYVIEMVCLFFNDD